MLIRLLLILAVSLIIGCNTGTGPGSAKDAVKFARTRIAQLEGRTTFDENGKSMEIRNAYPGYSQSTTFGRTSTKATLEYEYRIISYGSFENMTEAESAKLELEISDWSKKKESYIFKNRKWTPEDAD